MYLPSDHLKVVRRSDTFTISDIKTSLILAFTGGLRRLTTFQVVRRRKPPLREIYQEISRKMGER